MLPRFHQPAVSSSSSCSPATHSSSSSHSHKFSTSTSHCCVHCVDVFTCVSFIKKAPTSWLVSQQLCNEGFGPMAQVLANGFSVWVCVCMEGGGDLELQCFEMETSGFMSKCCALRCIAKSTKLNQKQGAKQKMCLEFWTHKLRF